MISLWGQSHLFHGITATKRGLGVTKMPMNFKVTFADGTSTKLLGLPDDVTLDGLRAHLFEKTSIAPQDQHGEIRCCTCLLTVRGERHDAMR